MLSRGSQSFCPLDAVAFTAFSDPGEDAVRVGLAHLASRCPRCWKAVGDAIEGSNPSFRIQKAVEPIRVVYELLEEPLASAPTVRLGMVLREVAPEGPVTLSEEGYYRLLLESWLYGCRQPLHNAIGAELYSEWFRDLLGRAPMPETEELKRLWCECQIENHLGTARLAHYQSDGISQQAASELARQDFERFPEAGLGDTALWWRILQDIRIEGLEGGDFEALESLTRTLESLWDGGAFDPVLYEVAMDLETERQRRTLSVDWESWKLYLRILEDRSGLGEEDEYPCLAARAARHVDALAMQIVRRKGLEEGLLYRVALKMRQIYPDMCAELVEEWLWPGPVGGYDAQPADWLEELEWEEWEAFGCPKGEKPRKFFGYLMLHSEDINLVGSVPTVEEAELEGFKGALKVLEGFSFLADVCRDGRRMLALIKKGKKKRGKKS